MLFLTCVLSIHAAIGLWSYRDTGEITHLALALLALPLWTWAAVLLW